MAHMNSWLSFACLTVFLAALAGLTSAAAAADAAAQSPPPEQVIAFSSNRNGPWSIWTIKPDGSQLRQLSKPAQGEQDVDPAFNADGSRILFTSTRGGSTRGGTAGLWQVGRDGTNPQRLCDGDQGSWSPDGKSIVFRRAGKLLTRELASGKDTPLTPEGWDTCSGGSWSPDGTTVAFARKSDNANAVFIIPASGGTPTRVYDKQGACQPHWSPSGKNLVYETETHLCTINPDGTKNRLITYFGGLQRYARYSPDGKELVFCQAAAPEGPWELYIIPATGGTPRKLTDGGSDMYPDWK
jgi:Tol biopolymer transport system component